MKTKLLQEIPKRIPKKREKYIKKYNFRKKNSYFPICGPKHKIYVSHERFQSLEKNAKKNFFDTFTLDGPLEPMVINFTCDLSLVCIPPR